VRDGTFPVPYARRAGDVRVLWVVANRSDLHTHHMSGTTTVNTPVTSVRGAAGNKRKVKRFGPTLLLALPFLVALVPELVNSTPTIDVTVSRDAVSPGHSSERISKGSTP